MIWQTLEVWAEIIWSGQLADFSLSTGHGFFCPLLHAAFAYLYLFSSGYLADKLSTIFHCRTVDRQVGLFRVPCCPAPMSTEEVIR